MWRPWVKSTHHISHFNEINIISTNTKFEGSGVKKIMTISKPHKQEEIHFEVSEFVSVNFSHSKKLSFQWLKFFFKLSILSPSPAEGLWAGEEGDRRIWKPANPSGSLYLPLNTSHRYTRAQERGISNGISEPLEGHRKCPRIWRGSAHRKLSQVTSPLGASLSLALKMEAAPHGGAVRAARFPLSVRPFSTPVSWEGRRSLSSKEIWAFKVVAEEWCFIIN